MFFAKFLRSHDYLWVFLPLWGEMRCAENLDGKVSVKTSLSDKKQKLFLLHCYYIIYYLFRRIEEEEKEVGVWLLELWSNISF